MSPLHAIPYDVRHLCRHYHWISSIGIIPVNQDVQKMYKDQLAAKVKMSFVVHYVRLNWDQMDEDRHSRHRLIRKCKDAVRHFHSCTMYRRVMYVSLIQDYCVQDVRSATGNRMELANNNQRTGWHRPVNIDVPSTTHTRLYQDTIR